MRRYTNHRLLQVDCRVWLLFVDTAVDRKAVDVELLLSVFLKHKPDFEVKYRKPLNW